MSGSGLERAGSTREGHVARSSSQCGASRAANLSLAGLEGRSFLQARYVQCRIFLHSLISAVDLKTFVLIDLLGFG